MVTANKHDTNIPPLHCETGALNAERSIKKQLSFDIAKLNQRELRAWKSSRLQQLLNMSNRPTNENFTQNVTHHGSIVRTACWKIFIMDIQVIQQLSWTS